MTGRRIALWSSALALILLVAGAAGISSNDQHIVTPEITASPDAVLNEPEPTITASSDVALPPEPKPEVTTEAGPRSPANIPSDVFVSTPRYVGPVAPTQPRYIAPQLPLPAPQQPPVAPSVPLPKPVLPPEVGGPVRGLVGPLLPPILEPIIPPILK